ncbi:MULTISPECIES: hypothetical protein [unclassified Streptomyces]|uniref:hypothetical protein n=1 Tax=unclassified Streptomyces TaxID=2593676 RepID=UPI0006F6CA12|nr:MULTISPECIES: hypothetical protein [unclassified Streptomyces]KQX50679.1 hypothetical protein ASD33_11475 [Streptomyces sp. Root1304]KRA84843.1 hypothetical protein ASE09_11480 [Streptomyces sp. Root66D1]
MFAAVCVLLAATGHVLMSGRDLSVPALGLALAGTLAVAWILARRERGLLAVTAATVAVQSALHAVFSWSQRQEALPPGQPASDQTATAHAAMGHMGMGHADMAHEAMGHALPGSASFPHDMTDMSSSLGMLSAHLLAALLSGLWMAYGERAAFRLVRSLPLWRFRSLLRPLRLLLVAVVPLPPRRPRIRSVRAGDARAPRQPPFSYSVISRGPPRALAVF